MRVCGGGRGRRGGGGRAAPQVNKPGLSPRCFLAAYIFSVQLVIVTGIGTLFNCVCTAIFK